MGVDTGKYWKNKSDNFQPLTYYSVFSAETEKEIIFEIAAKPLINSILEGINGTLFCQGQIASGKTYTIEEIHRESKLMGVIPSLMRYVFYLIKQAISDIEYSVKCQYYQIYNEKI